MIRSKIHDGDLNVPSYADWFGQGDDGNVVLPPGTTTLTADALYDVLIVPSGATLVTGGFVVHARTKIWVQVGGKVTANGGAGAGTVGGAAAPGTNVGAGGVGGTGGTGTGGNGGAQNNQPPRQAANVSKGGAGGTGNGGTGAGSAGTATTVTAPVTPPSILYGAYATGTKLSGGSGGGAGGGNGAGNTGGAGGGGGGVVLLRAPNIQIDGLVEAKGGRGADGVGVGAGGGGGGGGGKIIFASLQGGVMGANNVDVSGGGKGLVAAGGAATDGNVGNPGCVYVQYVD